MTVEFEEVGSGAKIRPKREELLKMARPREIDEILVWKLDRFGRSMAALVISLNELREIGVVFVFLTKSLDFSTPSGRAMAGTLSTIRELPLIHLKDCGDKTLWDFPRLWELAQNFRFESFDTNNTENDEQRALAAEIAVGRVPNFAERMRFLGGSAAVNRDCRNAETDWHV